MSEGEREGETRAFIDDGGFQCLTCVDLDSK